MPSNNNRIHSGIQHICVPQKSKAFDMESPIDGISARLTARAEHLQIISEGRLVPSPVQVARCVTYGGTKQVLGALTTSLWGMLLSACEAVQVDLQL